MSTIVIFLFQAFLRLGHGSLAVNIFKLAKKKKKVVLKISFHKRSKARKIQGT